MPHTRFHHSSSHTMGSDNSGKRAKASRLLVPAVAIVILVLGSIVFLMGETPNQVGEWVGSRREREAPALVLPFRPSDQSTE